MTYFVNKQVDL